MNDLDQGGLLYIRRQDLSHPRSPHGIGTTYIEIARRRLNPLSGRGGLTTAPCVPGWLLLLVQECSIRLDGLREPVPPFASEQNSARVATHPSPDSSSGHGGPSRRRRRLDGRTSADRSGYGMRLVSADASEK